MDPDVLSLIEDKTSCLVGGCDRELELTSKGLK